MTKEDVQRGFTRTVAAVCDICGKEIPKGTHVLVIPRRNRDRVERSSRGALAPGLPHRVDRQNGGAMIESLRPTYNRQLHRGEIKVIDAKAGRVMAVVSTETRDRDGDIIRQAGWDLDNFMKNPVMLDSHRYGSLEAVIGRWESMEVKGKKLIGEATYRIGKGQLNADIAFDIAREGGAAFSVGFIPDMTQAKEIDGGDVFWPTYEFNKQELLEVSQVSVPSNPDAMQRMKGLHPLIDEMIAEKLADGPPEHDYKQIIEDILWEKLQDPEFVDTLAGLIRDANAAFIANEVAQAAEALTDDIPDIAKIFREARKEALHG